MIGDPNEEFVVELRISDLVPEARAVLSKWLESDRDSAAALTAIVRTWYEGIGMAITAESETIDGGPDRLLRIRLVVPPESDAMRAATEFEEGLRLAEAGQVESAAIHFSAAAELWPFDHQYHRAQGQCALELGRLEHAGNAFRAALALSPRDADSLTMLGNVYYAAGDLDTAEDLHLQAVGVRETAIAVTNLGAVLGKKGRLAEAATRFSRALELDPAYERARLGLEACQQRRNAG